VQNIIQRNAELEFECIWREHERTGRPRSVLSDELSEKINQLTDSVSESTLWDQSNIKNNVLLAAMPPTLLKLLGLNKILERVPPAYAKAVFCAFLASRFVYTSGLAPSEFKFFRVHSALARAGGARKVVAGQSLKERWIEWIQKIHIEMKKFNVCLLI
jgi:glutamate dehydrogenase